MSKGSSKGIVKIKSSKEETTALILDKLPGYFLISCLLLTLSFLLYILWPFLTPIFVAAVLTIAFHSYYKSVLKLFRGRSWLASLVSCLIVALVIVVPVTLFVLLVSSEALDAYATIRIKVESGFFDHYLQWENGGFFYDWFSVFKEKISPVFDVEKLNLKQDIINIAQALSSYLGDFAIVFAEKFSSFLFGVFIMFFSLYYFFKDGNSLVDKLGAVIPFPLVYENELFSKLGSMVKAVVFGVFFTALLQGLVGGIGFAIVGISSPVFWGAAMAFLSLIPVVGTAIIWVPAVIFLLIFGSYGSALFLFLWGVFLVGSVDNIARTYLIGGKAQTYPLITFFVILGGVLMMGLKGVIIGPLVLMGFMSLLHIYQSEYAKVLKK